MTLVREFNLYLTAGKSIPLVINVNQFDSGEQWVFTLYKEDGTQYTPSTGAIVGIKSDGLGIINSGSVVDGKVVINETEQMTAAAGKAVFELLIDSQTHGTANFVVLVEPKPGNNADLSESDLSLLQEAIDATSPLPTGGTVGQVLTKTAQGSAWSDAGTPTQEQVAEAVSDWANEHITVETGVVIDTSLSVAGAAADAKATGDEISDLKSHLDEVTFDKAGTNINNCGYEGGYIASNGTDTTASSYESVAFRSNGYIPVVGGETLYWWGKLSDGVALGANAVIVEYDASKNLIGTRHSFDKYGTTGSNQAFTTSQNAAFVRIAVYQGVEDKSTIQIALYYSGDEQALFIPYQSGKVLNYNKVYTTGGESLDDVIDDKIAAIGFSPIYELQPITVTGESGALLSDGAVMETTDVTRYKIPVLAGEKYVVSSRHGYRYRAFLVLDSNSNILSYFPETTSGTAIHRNVEVNITEDGFLVVQDVYNFPPYIGKAVSVDFNDKLYQKSIYWNGDSICYGAGGFSFANQIGLIHAMPETMDAVSGTRLSIRTGRTDSIYDRVVAMDTTAEYDFIGIEGGYNDYFSSVPIGTLMANYTDTPDTTTVIGAVEGICKHIRTNFPNSKFFFVLGHRPIAVGAYPTEVDTYWDAIITALNKWAVPYVDIRKEGTLMAYNADWLADYFGTGETMGTHPNTEGYTKFYNPLVEDRMKSL